MSRIRVGVVFGGQSVEHEVSVISAQQAMAALDSNRFEVIPLYISKAGAWFTGDRLLRLDAFRDLTTLLDGAVAVTPLIDASRPGRLAVTGSAPGRGLGRVFGRGDGASELTVDVILPLVHGSHGEDGTLAGLCQMWGVAHVGCGVTAAALSMDKPVAKHVLRDAGLPVLDELVFSREQWRKGADEVLAAVHERFADNVFVKPATLGSSIGVSHATDAAQLRDAIDLAVVYDGRFLIEPAQQDIIEINCAVLGRADQVRPSACEQPISQGLLSYADKYSGGVKGGSKSASTKLASPNSGMKSAQRLIPAPLDAALTERIQSLACAAFVAIGGAGVARIDFMVRPSLGEVIINEINTVPGSLAFYLFEPVGLGFQELMTELIDLALAEHAEQRSSTYSIDSWLLSAAAGGSKRGAVA